MKEQFVTYEIALKLKELGFNEECFAFYLFDKQLQLSCAVYNTNSYWEGSKLKEISAPLWQQAIDWLEENNIVVEILPAKDIKYTVAYYMKNKTSEEIYEFFHNAEVVQYTLYDTKIKAREAAVLKAIELKNRLWKKNL